MKRSEIYKSVIEDVICACGEDITEDITDECFEKLRMLFSEYNSAVSMEKFDETRYPEDCIRVAGIS